MTERRTYRPISEGRTLGPGIVLDNLALEHNRRMSHVCKDLSRSDEYAIAGSSDIAWFVENPDEAIAKLGILRSYQRIVFFGSEVPGGFETVKFDTDKRNGSGAFIVGSPIPKTFHWNSALGIAALRAKSSK